MGESDPGVRQNKGIPNQGAQAQGLGTTRQWETKPGNDPAMVNQAHSCISTRRFNILVLCVEVVFFSIASG